MTHAATARLIEGPTLPGHRVQDSDAHHLLIIDDTVVPLHTSRISSAHAFDRGDGNGGITGNPGRGYRVAASSAAHPAHADPAYQSSAGQTLAVRAGYFLSHRLWLPAAHYDAGSKRRPLMCLRTDAVAVSCATSVEFASIVL